MIRAALKSLLGRKVRLLMSTFAIVLGVAFVAGTLVFSDTLNRSFTALFASTVGDVVVQPLGAQTENGTPSSQTLPASLLDELEQVDGSESPALVLVAGGYDPRALATIDWLASKHDVPVYAYTVSMVRFGGERLLTVRREPADNADADSEVDFLLKHAAREDVQYTEAPQST